MTFPTLPISTPIFEFIWIANLSAVTEVSTEKAILGSASQVPCKFELISSSPWSVKLGFVINRGHLARASKSLGRI